MFKKIRPHQKINVRIIGVMVILFAVATVVTSVMNRRDLTKIYETNFREYVLLTNRLIAKLVDDKDTQYFIDLLANQPEDFKERQVQYYYDRNALYELITKNAASGPAYEDILNRMNKFREETNALKNDRYWEIVRELEELRRLSHARYIYVFADTGLKTREGEKLYPYIFIAEDVPVIDTISYDNDWLGTSYTGEPVVPGIFETGRPMDDIIYYNDMYGELCYAYSPILNDQGEAIAILGTDLSLEDMRKEVNASIRRFEGILVTFRVITALAICILITRSVITPLRDLTKTALAFTEGDIEAIVPPAALKQRSELGVLAKSLTEMNAVYKKMIKSMEVIFDAAIAGKLNTRGNEAEYKGELQKVVGKINDTLDIMVTYLNLVPAGIFIMDDSFKVNFCNERFSGYFGTYSAEEFFWLVFAGDSDVFMLPKDEKIKYLLAQEAPQTVWLNNACFSVTAKRLRSKKRGQDVIMTLIVEITDLMREKDNAQAATKSKSDFLARMSHEIRTPMNAIIGMTRIAQQTEDAAKLRHCLSTIESSSKLLLGIINDVLDMSKIETGKLELEHRPFNLGKILSVIRDVLDGDLEKKHLAFSMVLSPGTDSTYMGDEMRLSQVITNLLSNALKFTQDYGRISLQVKETGREGRFSTLLFTVTDTGIGLTREQMGRLFTSFEQADGSITRRFGGTGLGLAISKSIVEKMDGRIWAESEYGAGSKFMFEVNLERLPENMAGELPAPPGETPDYSDKTILLAEDIEINREIFIAHLTETNMTIETVENGLEAVKKFKENPEKYDLIVMDVQMPGMDGLEAAREIRAQALPRAQDIPIIALTADVFTDDISECLKSGMNDHLSKPLSYEQLMEKLGKYLRGKT